MVWLLKYYNTIPGVVWDISNGLVAMQGELKKIEAQGN